MYCAGRITVVQGDHVIGGKEIMIAILKLNSLKTDDVTRITSEHIRHAKGIISEYLAMPSTSMLWHRMSPDSMLRSTMVYSPFQILFFKYPLIQRLRLRWNGDYADNYFTLSHGVTEGRVISPCVY